MLDDLLIEIEMWRYRIIETTQSKCVYALMKAEEIDFASAADKLGLSISEAARIRGLLLHLQQER